MIIPGEPKRQGVEKCRDLVGGLVEFEGRGLWLMRRVELCTWGKFWLRMGIAYRMNAGEGMYGGILGLVVVIDHYCWFIPREVVMIWGY